MAELAKKRRMEFRTTSETRVLVDRAVASSGGSLSEFAERVLRREASRILADQSHFILSEEGAAAWDALNEKPAETLAGLKALMERPSPFSD